MKKKLLALLMFIPLGLYAQSNLAIDAPLSKDEMQIYDVELNKLKNKDFNNLKKTVCKLSTPAYLIAKDKFESYCENLFDDRLAVLAFKLELSKWNNDSNKEPLVPDFKTLKGYNDAINILWGKVKVNPRYDEYVLSVVNNNLLLKEEKDKRVMSFVNENKTAATEKEFNVYERLYKDIKNQEGKILKNELLVKNEILKEFKKNNNNAFNIDTYEKVFNFERIKANNVEIDNELSKVLKNKEMLDSFYQLIPTNKIFYIIKELGEKKEVTLSLRECEFLRDYKIFSKEGLRALTCISEK